MSQIMNLKSLSKKYGSNIAIKNVTLKINEGEILVLLGPNGSGKSTLLKIIATLISPDSGYVTFKSFIKKKKDSNFFQSLGFLFDESIHWEKLTGYENAWFFAKNYGLNSIEATKRLDYLFKWSNLYDKKDDLVASYSFGMKRKLALIESLIHQPKVLLLDEPTIGLDYKSRLAFYTLLKNEAERGTSIVLATNDVNEAALLADKVAFFDKGQILMLDTPKNLMNSLQTFARIELSLAFPIELNFLNEIEEVKHHHILEREENNFQIELLIKPKSFNESTKIIANIINLIATNNGVLLNFNIKNPNLGDIFIKLEGA